MFSIWHMVLFLVILLVFMGPGRIEKLGPSLGKALRGFKKGLSGDDDSKKEDDADETARVVAEQTKRLETKIESLEKRAKKKASVDDEDT